jgi:hypothetical protein
MPIEIRRPEVIREKTEEEKVVSSLIEAAKSSSEVTEKLSDILGESIDKTKLKKMIIEEALKDPELRNKIMLELIKKL